MRKKGAVLASILLVLTILITMFSFTVSAADGTSSIRFSENKTQFAVGDTITVTATFSSAKKLAGIEGSLIFDKKLQYVKTLTSDCQANSASQTVYFSYFRNDGKDSATITLQFQFKAITQGSCEISLDYLVGSTSSLVGLDISKDTRTLTVVSKSEKASSDANLKALSVSAGTLTPAFSPNITSYNVTIPYSETEFWVQATKSHSKATYVVQGSKDMKVGNNKRVVVVTAENGTTKSYTINIIRLDQNGNQVTEDPDPTDENRIEVAIGEEIKYIGEDFASDIIPAGFKVIDYVYEDKTVAAIENDEYVMLYLVDPKTDKGDFYIIGSDNAFTELIKIEVGGQIYYILPTEKVPEGCQAISGCDINGVLVNAFKHSDPAYADFYTIYALGPQGNIGFYNYDTVEKTIQRSLGLGVTLPEQQEQETETTFLENILAMNLSEKIVAITIILIILLLIAAIIVLIVKIASSGEKKPKEKVEEIDDSQSVGFEYVSVKDPSEKPTVPIENPEFEITPKTEETVSLEDIEEDKE